MSVTISPAERDALYNRVVVRLTGIDDVYTAVEEEDWSKAQRLGEEFSDLLQLICNDLGWGDQKREDAFLLQTPPEILRRAIESLREMTGHERAHFEGEREKIAAELEEISHIEDTCNRILAGLG